jgi:hypothetical protein
MSNGKVYTPIPSAARTATFNHDLEGLAKDWDEMALYVNCTAASGTTPTLDISYQTTMDGGTTWFTHTSFTQLTTTGTEKKVIAAPIGVDSRILCTIGGTTPSFTFSVAAEMKRSY